MAAFSRSSIFPAAILGLLFTQMVFAGEISETQCAFSLDLTDNFVVLSNEIESGDIAIEEGNCLDLAKDFANMKFGANPVKGVKLHYTNPKRR